MKNFNIVKLDSKGRLLIPFHIRQYLGLKQNMELMVVNNEKKELRMFPLIAGSSARVNIMLKDVPGSLSGVAQLLADHGLDILMSESRTIERGKLAHWSAVVDTTKCSNIDKSVKALNSLEFVTKAEIEKK